MESLLPTCWGSMQPASEPTANRRVPPLTGFASAPVASALPSPPQAVNASRAVAVTSARGVLRVFIGSILSLLRSRHRRAHARWSGQDMRCARLRVLAEWGRPGQQTGQDQTG